MKPQLVCLIILLGMTIQSLQAFTIQTQAKKGIAALGTHNAEGSIAETSPVQELLLRSKRFSSHFPICTYCCKCCGNKNCGFCCRT